MSTLSLLVGAAAPAATGTLLLLVGESIRRRPVHGQNRPALLAFAAWWYGMGASILCYTGQSYLAAAGVTTLAPYQALLLALALFLSIALGGLVYYLLFLYTGRRGLAVPVVAFYTAYYVFNLYRFIGFGPYELYVYEWSATARSAVEPPAWVFLTFTFATTIPVLLSALAYGALYFRTTDPTNRYRIATVTIALALWFGSLLVGFLVTDPRRGAAPILFQSLGFVFAFLILNAFEPPQWVRNQLGLRQSHPA